MEYGIERRDFLVDISLIHREADWAAGSLSFRSLVLFNGRRPVIPPFNVSTASFEISPACPTTLLNSATFNWKHLSVKYTRI